MAQSGTDVLEREVRIRASRTTVFSYLTDPSRVVEWFGTAATLDPRPGGVYRVDVEPGHIASGRFVEVDPPRRVVFTFGWEEGERVPPGSSTVEITLAEEDDETVLTLVHRHLPEASIEPHGTGWTRYLDRLVITASAAGPAS